ncbi:MULTISPECIES: hypothetical protein [Actinomycetes]|uniref:hypothetical protein n=1 Tax=Actinomycetes TaxID=1760 RepID=UPI0004C21102|nr:MULTISPECIES: hypothetical protein [Actinomycetes]
MTVDLKSEPPVVGSLSSDSGNAISSALNPESGIIWLNSLNPDHLIGYKVDTGEFWSDFSTNDGPCFPGAHVGVNATTANVYLAGQTASDQPCFKIFDGGDDYIDAYAPVAPNGTNAIQNIVGNSTNGDIFYSIDEVIYRAAPDGSKLYEANVSGDVSSLVYNSVDNRLYAYSISTVRILDAGTGAEIAAVPVGSESGELAVDGSGNTFVVNASLELSIIQSGSTELGLFAELSEEDFPPDITGSKYIAASADGNVFVSGSDAVQRYRYNPNPA